MTTKNRWSLLLMAILLAAPLAAQDDLEAARKLFDEGRFARAAEIYERIHLADRDDYEACMGLGRSLYMQHENNRSLGLFERARRLEPERAEPWLWQGYVLERSGVAGLDRQAMMARPTLADAVAAYRRAFELDPAAMNARISAIRVLFLLERHDETLAEIEAALAIEPDQTELLAYRLGVLYRSERWADFLAACAEVEGKLSLDLGRMLDANARLGRVVEAEALFLRMFDEGYSGRNEPFMYLSRAWAEGARLEDQIRVLRLLLEKRPEEWLGRYYLGYALAVAGRLPEARRAFESYLENDPDNVTTLAHLVRIARLEGRLGDARRLGESLLGRHPDSEAARTETAEVVLALVEAKQFPVALALHSRLYDLDPEDPDLARNQAVLLKENGLLEESLAIMSQLVAEAPVATSRLASFMNDRGLCLIGLGRLEEALAAFEEAAKTWEREADARENLGVLLARLGRKEEARRALLASIEARRAEGSTEVMAFGRARYHLRALDRRP